MKRQKIRMAIGVLLISSNFIIGQFAAKPSTTVDFVRGFVSGLGLILVLSSFFALRKKA
ncbi:MAG TPA: hypothetical protein VK806_09305 [Bacteroidia bacterium]|nr:hypothetical protein [Bacteroidia bacterium]